MGTVARARMNPGAESDRGAAHTVAVLGAGIMGQGIVHAIALARYSVRLFDPADDQRASALDRIRKTLEKGVARGKLSSGARDLALGRIEVVETLASAVSAAWLVIEAAPERLEIKREIFAAADAASPAHTVLASNTSSLSISRIAESTHRPERVLGLHFFNPVPAMRLIEIVRGAETAEAAVKLGLEFARSLDKEPIVVADTPGFATSRLGVVLGLEAIRMLEQGVASAADIDRAMELGYNHPMGPLRLTDLIGLDTRLEIADHLWSELGEEQYRPPALLRSMVAAGRLGKKSGEGFYQWSEG